MNAITRTTLPAIGAAFEGGFYAGLIALNGETYGIVVSPKASGELEEASLGTVGKDMLAARHFNDGLANTQAMAEAGSDLARWMLALDINGFADWYLPSRDELELLYRHFKPTTESNWVYRHGENPSSVPMGYPYTAEQPGQTQLPDFQADAAEAFEDTWYWSSTQYSPFYAWVQGFDVGNQLTGHKDHELRARAVRRFKVTP
ncbi:MAG: DUF1566 domain-containing protein [Ectopseudomonas guguanensis]|uniref:Lcl domain-containing protein n=1 Tax=Ectopseudomonas guguanensis TaxID=1198456 RepID=UPI00391A6920